MTFLIRNIFQSPRLIIPEQGSAPARPYIFPSLKWFTVSSHFPGLLCSVFRPDLAGDIDQLFQCRIFANKAAPQNIGRAAGAAGGVGRQALYWTWTPTCSHRAGGGSGLQPRTLQTCSRVAIIITTNNCVFFYSTICTLATTTTVPQTHSHPPSGNFCLVAKAVLIILCVYFTFFTCRRRKYCL